MARPKRKAWFEVTVFRPLDRAHWLSPAAFWDVTRYHPRTRAGMWRRVWAELWRGPCEVRVWERRRRKGAQLHWDWFVTQEDV